MTFWEFHTTMALLAFVFSIVITYESDGTVGGLLTMAIASCVPVLNAIMAFLLIIMLMSRLTWFAVLLDKPVFKRKQK